jgi:hypothetical protein
MEFLAISVLLLLVFVQFSSSRPAKPQVVFVVERSSSRPDGCLVLLLLAAVTVVAISRL